MTLLPQSSEEKARVAAGAGKTDWDPGRADEYPTPGTIVMEDALRYMRGRFRDLPGEQQDLLRALQLLALGGVLPLTHQRIEAALSGVFGRAVSHLGDALAALGERAFIRPPYRQDPVVTDPAYLTDPVLPSLDRATLVDQLTVLGEALKGPADAPGLALLGYSFAVTLDENAHALVALDASLALRPDDPATLNNRGAALGKLDRTAEALAAYDASLALRHDDPATLTNRGAALGELDRTAEALAALDASLALRPDDPTALHNRGVALAKLDRTAEALAAFDASLALRPDDPTTLHSRGLALANLGRWRRRWPPSTPVSRSIPTTRPCSLIVAARWRT